MKHLVHRAAAVLVALLALAAAGCSDSTGADPGTALAGRYTLQTINGQATPFVLKDDAASKIEVLDGFIDLEADGEFTQALLFRTTPVGGSSVGTTSVTVGSASVNGGSIHFENRPSGSGSFNGSISGNVIAYTIQGNNGPLEFRFARS
jgi:hypothetical protein